MAGPWEDYAAPVQAAAVQQGPWTEYAAPASVPPQPKPFGVLPLAEDAQGNIKFDPTAGVLGSLIRGVSAPNDARLGRFDPMSPEGQARARETAMFGLPMSPAMRAGELAIPGALKSTRQTRATVPTAPELKTAADQGYTAVRNTGAEYPGAAIGSTFENAAQDAFQTRGIFPENAPQTFAVVDRLRNPPDGSVITISALDAARQALSAIPRPIQGQAGTDHAAAQAFIKGIDDFIQSRGAAPPVAGAPSAGGAGAANGAGAGGVAAIDVAREEAARLIPDARGNVAAFKRSERITKAEDSAERSAAAANSGQNIGNRVRQRLNAILENENQSRGFSPQELAAIRQVVEGTATSNTLRYVGNLFGGGGGLGQMLTGITGASLGASVGGLEGALIGSLPGAAGIGSRAAYNGLMGRQVGKLDETIRQRSPLFQQRQASAGLLADPWDRLLMSPAIRGLLATGNQGLLGDYQP